MGRIKNAIKNRSRNTGSRHKLQKVKPSLPPGNLIGDSFVKSKSRGTIETKKNKRIQTLQQPSNQQVSRTSTAIIPFSPDEKILLIGEADLSFTRSLLEHHYCTKLTATVHESEAELKEKFPHVIENISVINQLSEIKIRYKFDAKNAKSWACFLRGRPLSKAVGTIDRIIFNFPHVGGKSKDFDRQIRYNQELLASFFKNAILCLSPSKGSSIIVTIFDGEPYNLWNIRGLARNCQLEVERSFVFCFAAYPGYTHSRTIGVVKARSGEQGGGWKGEERQARTFVFVRKGEGQSAGPKKKKIEDGSDEDDGK